MKKLLFITICLLIFISGFFAKPPIRVGGDVIDNLIMTDAEKIEALPEALKLEATTDKILNSGTVKDVRCSNVGNCIEIGDVKQYLYVSNVEVPTSTIEIPNGKKTITIAEDMSKRTNNAQFFKIGTDNEKDIWEGRFFQGEPFYKENNKWLQTKVATTTIEAFELQTTVNPISRFFKKIAFATDYLATDQLGEAQKNDSNNWTTTHDATAASAVRTTSGNAYVQCDAPGGCSGTNYMIRRFFVNINTSGIGAGNIVTAASFKVRSHGDPESGTGNTINVYDSSHSDPVVVGDFDLGGTTAYATALDHAAWGSADAWNTFTFNATGIAAVNVTGTTKFVVRDAGNDAANSQPSASCRYYGFHDATVAGTSEDPYLSVTFEAGGGGTAPANNGTFLIFE